MFDKWNGDMKTDNKQATVFALAIMHIFDYLSANYALYNNTIPEIEIFNAFNNAQKFLMKNYNTLEVELGRVQKITRGNVEFSMYGCANTLASSGFYVPHKKGQLKCVSGDTFIFFAQYGKDGLEELKAINVFGNSNKPSSKHYTDQLEMFVNMELRSVVLENDAIKKQGIMYYPQ